MNEKKETHPLEKVVSLDERIISRFWILPEELHNWYLQAISTLKPKDFNPNAQKIYDELTEGQKLIDMFIAKELNERLKNFEQQIRADQRENLNKLLELIFLKNMTIEKACEQLNITISEATELPVLWTIVEAVENQQEKDEKKYKIGTDVPRMCWGCKMLQKVDDRHVCLRSNLLMSYSKVDEHKICNAFVQNRDTEIHSEGYRLGWNIGFKEAKSSITSLIEREIKMWKCKPVSREGDIIKQQIIEVLQDLLTEISGTEKVEGCGQNFKENGSTTNLNDKTTESSPTAEMSEIKNKKR